MKRRAFAVGPMGDVRFRDPYVRVASATDRPEALRSLDDDDVIAALAYASRERDPLLANVLATEAFNRMRRSRIIARTVGEAVLGFDANALLAFANPAAERLLGAKASELWHRRWSQIAKNEPFDASACPIVRVVETSAPIADRTERIAPPGVDAFWAEWSAYPVEHEREVLGVIMVVRDVTARKDAEGRRATRHALTAHLSRSKTVEDAAPDILRIVGQGFGWEAGALWQIDEDARVLRCSAFWSAPGTQMPRFEAATRDKALRLGQGVPGKVWETGEPFWVQDLKTLDAESFPRAHAAREDGLHAAFAFPCPVDRTPMAIVDFYSRELKIPDEPFLSAIEAMGSEVGYFVERRHAEERLRRSEARKSGVLQASLDAIVTIDAEGRVVDFNPAAEKLFGYTADEVIGQHLYATIVPHRFREAHRAGMARYLRTREARILGRHLELPALRKNGEELIVELYIVPVPGQAAPLFTSSMRDVTERKRAEEALRESEERFRATFEQAAIGLAHVAIDGRWVRVNQRLCSILGYTRDELLGLTFQDVTHPEDLGSDLIEAERLLRGEIHEYALDKRYVRKDGEIVPVRITVALVRKATGEPHYFIAAVNPLSGQPAARHDRS